MTTGYILEDAIKGGVYKGLKVKRKTVMPSGGDQILQCGNCGSMEFDIHVRPVVAQARITACVCRQCLKVRKFDPNGFIEGTRKFDMTKKEAHEFLGKEVISEHTAGTASGPKPEDSGRPEKGVRKTGGGPGSA